MSKSFERALTILTKKSAENSSFPAVWARTLDTQPSYTDNQEGMGNVRGLEITLTWVWVQSEEHWVRKTVWRLLKKLKIELTYDPSITLLGICSKNVKTLTQGTWGAQGLSICLWLRAWSQGPGIESHIGLPTGGLLLPLPVSLPLSVSLMNK